MLEENISRELSDILGDLERIGTLVAQKEAELGIARTVCIKRLDADCFELTIDDRVYYLDKARFDALASQIGAIAKESL
ncbi:MAG: hypothetical protein LBI57_07645 [Helicobacteraceae bacterium]|jgi:hypothetical protein|nr:hypothetical protein [Helicobacteraceae bacterium]